MPRREKVAARTVRPRDAATMILTRQSSDGLSVLMGKRSSAHTFMPDLYVFPGGRVDPEDSRPPVLSDMSEGCYSQMSVRTRRSLRAFPLAAIRETFEETGLLIGKPQRMECSPPLNWKAYFDLGVSPCLSGIRYFGRAITPPSRPKRFDARFFIADASDVLVGDPTPSDSAELTDLNWLPIQDALDTEIPLITRFVLSRIQTYLQSDPDTYSPFMFKKGVSAALVK